MSNALTTSNRAAICLLLAQPIYCIKPKSLTKFTFAGSRNGGVLLITQHKASQSEQDFLQKIAAAIGLSLPDIALICLQENPHANLKTLLAYFCPSKILYFGSEGETDLLPQLSYYSLSKIAETQYLKAERLHLLASSTTAKRQLWTQLKALFL